MNCSTCFGDISSPSVRYNTQTYKTNKSMVSQLCVLYLSEGDDISPKHVEQFMFMDEL
jgi:hypothetical protein